ncbi:MAG TPA: hypothetical protein VFY05_10020 [Candidatus Angelobacter sp.]|nr:hypothetical protein [Candidatus Angelobacter sp.]
MKSCTAFVLLLFATFSILNAFAYQTKLQQPATNSATQQQSSPVQVTARPAMDSVPIADAASQPAAVTRPRVIALGSMLVAEFSGSLNVKKLKLGDTVEARLAQDVISGGELVAKVGSRVLGHVTEVKTRSKDNLESRLGMVFDKILLKKHRELDFEAIVQALAPPVVKRSQVDEPDQMMPTLALALQSPPMRSTDYVRTGAIHGATPISGGVGVHGVYGLKDLRLAPAAPDTNSGPAIVSTKSDVKLQNGTQVVILVVY